MSYTLTVGQRRIPKQVLVQTEAFKKRNKTWEYMKWDFTEWEECIEEARIELQKDSNNPIEEI